MSSAASLKTLSDAALRRSLRLPQGQTTLPMRASASTRELTHVQRLTDALYARQARTRSGAPVYTLHDGPPYANGSLHMGHFMNKVLKDIINRRQMALGKRIQYVPGWDCHGLPIEMKALEAANKAAKGVKGAPPARLSPLEIRVKARACAEAAIAEQAADFQRWGVLADWDVTARSQRGNAYVTMDAAYEGAQLRVFQRMVEAGFVHRSLKPVYWSPSSTTALAEAELEYVDAHRSTSVYVAFNFLAPSSDAGPAVQSLLTGARGLQAVVWTTTPWTLPANVALAVHPDMEYVVAAESARADRSFLVAADRLDELARVLAPSAAGATPPAQLSILGRVVGAQLAGALFAHPLSAALPPVPELMQSQQGEGGVQVRTSRVICGSHVTNDSGSGIVHTAPGHGHDDFAVCQAVNVHAAAVPHGGASAAAQPLLPVLCPVDEAGKYDASLGAALHGLPVLKEGNEALLTLLRQSGQLLLAEEYTHRYPYDWRSKKPIIIRATKQWFVNVHRLMDTCRDALADVTMVPAASRNRLTAMLGTRTEWCISRQRSWGVPIPALYNKRTGEALMTPESVAHIADAIGRHGSNIWWEWEASKLLPPSITSGCDAAALDAEWVKGADTLDVWFDSGASWAAAWAGKPSADSASACASAASASFDLGRRSDMVLEGSDQHRGWFQSSLITGAAAVGAAPYRAVLTHGFVLDEQMRKMSKSLGNVIAPSDIINGRGGSAAVPATPSAHAASSSSSANTKSSGKGSGRGTAAGSSAFSVGQGVDVARYWVAASDYSKDVVVGPSVLSTISEHVRKIRNTSRFILGNIADYQLLTASASSADAAPHADAVAAMWSAPHVPLLRQPAALGPLERGILDRVAAFSAEVSSGYDAYAFMRVVNAVNAFVSVDLSSQYFDFCKDRLYAGLAPTPTQAVLWESLRALVSAVAPILPFTAEDVYQHSANLAGIQCAEGKDVYVDSTIFDAVLPQPLAAWRSTDAALTWSMALALRAEANKLLEAARAGKHIGSALEAKLVLRVPPSGPLRAVVDDLVAHGQCADLFLTSQVEVHEATPEAVASAATPLAAANAAAAQRFHFAAAPSFTISHAGHVSSNAATTSVGAGSGSGSADATDVSAYAGQVAMSVQPAEGAKCKRCWKYHPTVSSHAVSLCARCDEVCSHLGLWGS